MNIIEPEEFLSVGVPVACGFFGRNGGVSRGIYSSLNCGKGSSDDPNAVQENRARVARHMGGTLCSLRQVHSDVCLTLDRPEEAREVQADAMATGRPGIVLGVLTADCGPVLFHGQGRKGPVIGAAHAGWGGALRGVLENTVQAMIALGTDPASIRAAIGPCIRRESYEVSAGFESPFLARDAGSGVFFTSSGEGKLHFDLPGYIAFRLNRAGVTHITDTQRDTCAEENDFFSYRRTTRRQEKDYGRQLSCIVIRG